MAYRIVISLVEMKHILEVLDRRKIIESSDLIGNIEIYRNIFETIFGENYNDSTGYILHSESKARCYDDHRRNSCRGIKECRV